MCRNIGSKPGRRGVIRIDCCVSGRGIDATACTTTLPRSWKHHCRCRTSLRQRCGNYINRFFRWRSIIFNYRGSIFNSRLNAASVPLNLRQMSIFDCCSALRHHRLSEQWQRKNCCGKDRYSKKKLVHASISEKRKPTPVAAGGREKTERVNGLMLDEPAYCAAEQNAFIQDKPQACDDDLPEKLSCQTSRRRLLGALRFRKCRFIVLHFG